MRLRLSSILAAGLLACGSPPKPAPTSPKPDTAPADTHATAPAAPEQPAADAQAFDVKDSDKSSRPTQGKLKATATEAAVRLFVVDKNNAPIKGIAISLTAPDGKKYYTEETDADGFTEVLLPIGQSYGVVYLSLSKHDVSAKVDVANKPNLNLKLTMRYKAYEPPPAPPAPAPGAPPPPPEPGLVLDHVEFPTGKATLIGDSASRLDVVVEYMTHKKSVRIEISGHTDNVGDPKANKALSQKRADAVRDYLVSKGIDRARIESVGYGDSRPAAPNTTPEGRQKNRRIEAREL
jgi:outer membrane protein OmpA-like peptidoglycan-associated protein